MRTLPMKLSVMLSSNFTSFVMLALIAIATFVITLLGGFFAIRFRDKLHLILGFSAGAVIGVALFDLLPEALTVGRQFWDVTTVMFVVAVGFAVYMTLDRIFFTHAHCDDETPHEEHNHRGAFGAGSLSFHSFLDGVAIGVAFSVSHAVGAVVAAAVLAHDFSDGVNTASMILRHGGTRRGALKWVVLDAIAPVAGVICTLFFTIPQSVVALLLALFGGFFLYIGASDLLPESHHSHPTRWTTLATALGMAVIYVAVVYVVI